jgi:hypothetical protein
LRMTLGDTSKSARYIQTVPKKGYRFVEQVRPEPGEAEASTGVCWTRSTARYASVAVLAALLALLFAHTRYQKFIPTHGVPAPASSR